MSDRFLCCEGDMDRVVFGRLPKAARYQVLPEKSKPCTAPPTAGAPKAFERAIDLVRQNVPIVVAALDLNGDAAADLYGRAETGLRKAGLAFSGGTGRYTVSGTSFLVLPVGLKGNADLTSLGIASHAIDDFLVLLLLKAETYRGVVESNARPAPDHARAVDTVKSAAAHIRSTGVAFNSSKQILALFRAIIQFPASLASFADSVLRHAPPDVCESVLKPLDDALP